MHIGNGIQNNICHVASKIQGCVVTIIAEHISMRQITVFYMKLSFVCIYTNINA